LSNSIKNLLYLEDNIALIDTLLNSFFVGKKTDIKDKIQADVPLLSTIYLNTSDKTKDTELFLSIENIFTDKFKAVLESLVFPSILKINKCNI
jgi:hypothetical protein